MNLENVWMFEGEAFYCPNQLLSTLNYKYISGLLGPPLHIKLLLLDLLVLRKDGA